MHKTYQKKPQTLYYEYFVRAMAYIMTSKYIDCSKELEKYNKLGFIESDAIINFIINNYEIGADFENFFAKELVSFTNGLIDNLEYNKLKKIKNINVQRNERKETNNNKNKKRKG